MLPANPQNIELAPNFAELHKTEVYRRMLENASGKPLARAKAQQLLAAAAAAPVPALTAYPTATASPWVGHRIGIDTSDWQPPLDWGYLKGRGVYFGVPKAFEIQDGVSKTYWPQKTYADTIQRMYDAHVMGGGYMEQNGYAIAGEGPMAGYTLDAVRHQSVTECLEYIYTIQAMTNKASWFAPNKDRLSFWMIAVERWWQSYVEYNQYLRGQRTFSQVKVMEPLFIKADLDCYLDLLTTAMSKKIVPQIPILIYSGKWFTDAYMVNDGQNLFYNAAPKWAAAGIMICSARYPFNTQTLDWSKIFDGTVLPTGSADDLNAGTATWWQFAVHKVPISPSASAALDIDLAIQNNGQFDATFGAEPNPESITYTISGNAGTGGALITTSDEKTATSAADQTYLLTVPAGWSGMITPSKYGYSFMPASLTLSNVMGNLAGQDFTATPDGETPVEQAQLDRIEAKVDTLAARVNGIFK